MLLQRSERKFSAKLFETCELPIIPLFLRKQSGQLILASVVVYIETSHFFCRAIEMIGFYMKCNTGQK